MINIQTISDEYGTRVVLSDSETPSGEVCGIECESFGLALNLANDIAIALDKVGIRYDYVVDAVRLV